ncbi:AAA family ATPase [Nonomuraea glycinis]|uniref:Transcriptional regulator n=1 Tax=Nonomuraea glycinis TaxID=2047744 RepID=A0A918AFX0_9ACTN|nr:LuxR family transcriptional regulator [Nonomuraea glycinis]MCA2183140.1 AAA family ATPase [Nonomuraea glycinis]GGP17822.1 transcriptional regulator [Nonomuraea glycinis]
MDDQRQGMAHLRKLLEESVGGRGRIAMVTGAVATGKSELLHGFADQALEQGALPLSATGSRAERDLPLGVLSQLVRNTPTDEHRTATLDLLREGSHARMSRDPGAESFEHVDVQIVDALCTVLLKQSERRPLVIVVDDVHHADRASQLCLSYLARRVTYARIMLVFSVPDHHAHLRTLLHTEMARQPHCHAVRLAHLSAEGVAARVRRRAGAQAADLFAARCHELSGGNRLLVDALLEDLQATGEPGERYADAVLACLHRADPGLLPVARALAVLGEPGTAGRLLGQGEATTARAAQALTGAGLLAGGRFRHEAAASAVLAGLDGAELVDLHRRAAELTYQEGAPAPVVATHLLTASHAGDPWALSVLEEAARQALRDDGVESAIEYLKLALRACDDGRRRARIATTLVRATWRIDPGTPTGHLAELTEALHKGDLGGADAIVLARALLWHGHVADAKDVLSRLGELDREALAELAATRAWCRGSWPAFLPHLPEPPAEQASATARSLGADRRLESADALASALREGPSAELAQTAERVLRGSRLDEMSMDAVECALLTLTFTDRADRAAPWCDAFVTEAAGRHAPSRQARLSAIRAEIALRRGDLAAAARDAQRALDLISPDSWGVAVGAPLGVLLMAGAAMGRHLDYVRQAAQPVPEAMLETRFGPQYLYGRGRFALVSGQPRQALRDLRLCGELMGAWRMDVPEFIPWRVDAAEALVRLGEVEEARALIDQQLAGGGKRSRRVYGMALRVLAATAERRHRAVLLRRAADLLQIGGDRYEHARALFDLIDAYHAIGEHRRAGMLAGRARALATECHAGALADTAPRGQRNGGAGGQAAGPVIKAVASPVLSDAEQRVAALAADGYSNREISGKLFITVSTVEQHLTRIYRKLNVSRRDDLPPSLADRAV